MNGNAITDKYIKIDLKTQIRWLALYNTVVYNTVATQYPNSWIDEIINYVNKTIYSNK